MFYLVMSFKELNHFFHVVSVEPLHCTCRHFTISLFMDHEMPQLNKYREKKSPNYLLTSTYPKNPELISPAGKPMAIIFSVIYVISKSNPPSYIMQKLKVT